MFRARERSWLRARGRKGRMQGAYTGVDENDEMKRLVDRTVDLRQRLIANRVANGNKPILRRNTQPTNSRCPRAGDGSLFPINSRLSSSVLLILASQCRCSPPPVSLVHDYRLISHRRDAEDDPPQFTTVHRLSVVVVSRAIAYIYAREHPRALLDRMRTRCADRNTHNAFARRVRVLRFNAAAIVDLIFGLFTSRCSHMCSDVG